VQVELIPSAYRGTKAVVVLPESLITTAAAGYADGDSVLRAATRLNVASPEALSLVGATAARTGVGEPLSSEPVSRDISPRDPFAVSALLADPTAPGAVSGLGAPGGVGGPSGPSGPRRRSVVPDDEAPLEELPRRARPAAPAAPADHQVAASADQVAAPPAPLGWGDPGALPMRPAGHGDESRRLPRRMRPGSAEQLASGTPVRMPGAARPAEAPAPERARNLAASVQSSWQRSREADDMAETDLGVPDGAPDSEEK
jgi:hypothetical protein